MIQWRKDTLFIKGAQTANKHMKKCIISIRGMQVKTRDATTQLWEQLKPWKWMSPSPGRSGAAGLVTPPTRMQNRAAPSEHARTMHPSDPSLGFCPPEMKQFLTKTCMNVYSNVINNRPSVQTTRMPVSEWTTNCFLRRGAPPGWEGTERSNTPHGEPQQALLSDRSRVHNSTHDILEAATM